MFFLYSTLPTTPTFEHEGKFSTAAKVNPKFFMEERKL